MILYLGASSLVKFYIQEPHSDLVKAWVRSAEYVATCRIAYTEVISALSIRYRKGDLLKDDYDLVVKAFNKDWENYVKVDFDDLEAGNLAMKYDLPRLSAIHLSAASLLVREYLEGKAEYFSGINGGQGTAVFFSSADQLLCQAALTEGLTVLSLE
jgi:predicted nucleic acid-binding protein